MIPYHKTMIKDIHTHNLSSSGEAIISLSPREYVEKMNPDSLYSIGIHPWFINAYSMSEVELLARLTNNANVVAIGETGIDLVRSSVALFKQMQIFRRHIEISESANLPVIIHNVKAHDIICGLRRELKPLQPWIIHGFRGKPTVAKMLLDCGCSLSFGEHFNPESVKATPTDRLFAETDESSLNIDEITAKLSEVAGKDLTSTIKVNAARLFGCERPQGIISD